MDSKFIAIFKKLVGYKGKGVLLNQTHRGPLLEEYALYDNAKERGLVMKPAEAGVVKAINEAENLRSRKEQQVELLEEHPVTAEAARMWSMSCLKC